jgi:flagellar FliL protein
MAANRIEPTKPGEEPARAAEPAQKVKGPNPWIPLIANLVLMPAIAYALTTFVLLPKLHGSKAEPAAEAHGTEEAHGAAAPAKSPHGKNRFSAPLSSKILVNVAGTAGTRYLVASMTLVGRTADFKDSVDRNDPQLRDTASSILASKTLNDVDKPGMRNVIRAELISAFNDILGKESVTDLYLTEFAIQ